MLNYSPDMLLNLLLLLSIEFAIVKQIHGHGMMLDPVSRSSRWRYDKTAPINYDDNGLFCGGFGVQWFQNNGRCGLCGDDFAAAMPRANEIGGKYGQGVIVKDYVQAQKAQLGVKITTNHLGFFYFDICNLDEFQVESEDCFSANKIKFSDGNSKMYIGKKSGMIYPSVILPKQLNCKHCVLRWSYQAGNNWGPCGNGTFALGCGPQENFKGCSDIRITKKASRPKKHRTKSKAPLKKVIDKYDFLDYIDLIHNEEKERKYQPNSYDYFDSNYGVEEAIPRAYDFLNRAEETDTGIRSYDSAERETPYFNVEPFFKFEDESDINEMYNEINGSPFEIQDIVKEDDSEADEELKSDMDMFEVLFKFDRGSLENNVLDDRLHSNENF